MKRAPARRLTKPSRVTEGRNGRTLEATRSLYCHALAYAGSIRFCLEHSPQSTSLPGWRDLLLSCKLQMRTRKPVTVRPIP